MKNMKMGQRRARVLVFRHKCHQFHSQESPGKMDGIIPGANVKILAKTLQALSKVGDELFIEVRKEKLSLITINSSKTVCASFNFLESFFSSYEVNETELADNEGKLTCKLHMKVIMPLFRGNLEKKLDFFKIEYANNADVMLVKMKYRLDDIIMVHKLRLLESETLTIGQSADSGANNICAPSTLYNQLLTMFCLNDDEITFEVTKAKVVARNYCVGAPLRPKSIRSQVNLNAGEFSLYGIQEETTINFAIKPLRTVVHFADPFNLSIGLNFDKGGKPLSIIMRNPTLEASFIVATLNPNSDMQSTMTTSSIPSRILPRRNSMNKANITVEDQQALDNEDWDDFAFENSQNNGRNKNDTILAQKASDSSKSRSSSSKKSTIKNNTGTINNNNIKMKKTSPMKTTTESHSSGFTEAVEEVMNGLDEALVLESEKNNALMGRSSSKSGSDSSKPNRHFNFKSACKRDSVILEDDFADVVPRSPESPRTKRAKFVFGRCYDPTFHSTILGEVLATNSDSE